MFPGIRSLLTRNPKLASLTQPVRVDLVAVGLIISLSSSLSPANPAFVATRTCPRAHVFLDGAKGRSLIGPRVVKGNSGNGGSPSGETWFARRTRHRGLLKQILCSGREVIPLIGLWGARRVQVRKHQDLAPRWTPISLLRLHSRAQISSATKKCRLFI